MRKWIDLDQSKMHKVLTMTEMNSTMMGACFLTEIIDEDGVPGKIFAPKMLVSRIVAEKPEGFFQKKSEPLLIPR